MVQMVCWFIYYPLIVVQLILNAFADRPAQYAAVGKDGEVSRHFGFQKNFDSVCFFVVEALSGKLFVFSKPNHVFMVRKVSGSSSFFG